MAAPAFSIPDPSAARLADPALRDALLKFARRRLPPGEVDDLVQNTLADALVSASAPAADGEFQRWVLGIARHKVADLYRRRGRAPAPGSEVEGAIVDPGPGTGELAQWIERELPKTDGAEATLHWLLRESDGETLDEIARDAALPAPRVRQRVSRLRRHFQTRWLALGAAGLTVLLGAGLALHAWRTGPAPVPSIARESVTPLQRARTLRRGALEKCAAGAYRDCIAELDEAKGLDPVGEAAGTVVEARRAAQSKLTPTPAPSMPASTSEPQGKSVPPIKFAPKHAAPKPIRVLPLQKPRQQTLDTKKLQAPLPNQQADLAFDDPPAKSNTPQKKNALGKRN